MIYAISDGHCVKIGYTSQPPEKRLRQLQTGNPRRLRLIDTLEGDHEVESYIHRYFDKDRIRNLEWFNLKEELVSDFFSYIRTMRFFEKIGKVANEKIRVERPHHSKMISWNTDADLFRSVESRPIIGHGYQKLSFEVLLKDITAPASQSRKFINCFMGAFTDKDQCFDSQGFNFRKMSDKNIWVTCEGLISKSKFKEI